MQNILEPRKLLSCFENVDFLEEMAEVLRDPDWFK
jgi:hypothetical protein